MTRLIPVIALLAVAAAVVGLVVGGRDDGGYKVRAIFDNAGFIIPGEDVKVAGVKVGTIADVDVTDDFKAAIVLDITDPGYQDFRQDAECIVRPQSLIGERFVECEPTQARAAGESPPPELAEIEDGPGEGQRLLSVEHTSKAVDLDLINNIMREPERERLSIILSDLGVGLAGRGRDLNEVIRRADPALKEIDDVLAILASQNQALADLARDSDAALAPLARERQRVGSAIANTNAVAEATAERRADLQANFQRLPTFLRELRPTMERLGALSDEMTPVVSDLGAVAPDVSRLVEQLGPFAEAGVPAFESLGNAADVGSEALVASRPVIEDLRRLARALRPVGSSAAAVLSSLERTDGIERALEWIFYQAAAINGFDSAGHYLRAGLLVNQCSTYATERQFGCSANFGGGDASAGAAAVSGPRDESLLRTQAALAQALGIKPPETAPQPVRETRRRTRPAPRRDRPEKEEGRDRPAERRNRPSNRLDPATTPAPAPTPTPAPRRSEEEQVQDVLDYLFGSDKR
jgi:phospholipid/cholesterol/gamma-HCH transport system substrate-binding protein